MTLWVFVYDDERGMTIPLNLLDLIGVDVVDGAVESGNPESLHEVKEIEL